ncbi:transcriptional regulator BetI [Aeromonas bivalvium]|uniref:transcriptional regulator BetI n=1 Tax=Aeromonas TaxID=642 RepID=UPI0038D18FF5
MPIVGVSEKRRQQLIQATISSVAEFGLQHTTLNRISAQAGMSSGIISHYFGGKQALIEAVVRELLSALGAALRERLRPGMSPQARLMAIVEANFTPLQCSRAVARTWLAFWAQASHEPDLARLQRINQRRLLSNLACSFGASLPRQQALAAAQQSAAMIDGFWLRSALSPSPEPDFSRAERLCKLFILQRLTPAE